MIKRFDCEEGCLAVEGQFVHYDDVELFLVGVAPIRKNECTYICSICNTELSIFDHYGYSAGCHKYCPNCGTKQKGKTDGTLTPHQGDTYDQKR
jgi:hypothetical protein